MKTLTENQINFLLEYFFKAEEFIGWKNIAKELLNSGKCIVGGETRIWNGGIGNFIETKPAENAVNCLLYEFDLEYFLLSNWYKEISNQYTSILSNKKKQIELEYNEICSLSMTSI